VLQAPSAVGTECGGSVDTLVLDASLSYGFDRLAPVFEWTFSKIVNGTFTPPQSLFVAPFDAFFSVSNDTVSLPATLLTVDMPHTFYVRMCRPAAEGNVPSTTVFATVVRRNASLLKVTVASSTVVYRSSPVSLDATVVLCDYTGSSSAFPSVRRLFASPAGHLSYQWSQLAGPTVFTTPTSTSTSTSVPVVWNAFRTAAAGGDA
jgi:hypothetical protein